MAQQKIQGNNRGVLFYLWILSSIQSCSSQINMWVPYRLLSWHALVFVFPILVDWNRFKSKIIRNCGIDCYRFAILVNWLVSNSIDNDRLLSTFEIIDMLCPVICERTPASQFNIVIIVSPFQSLSFNTVFVSPLQPLSLKIVICKPTQVSQL